MEVQYEYLCSLGCDVMLVTCLDVSILAISTMMHTTFGTVPENSHAGIYPVFLMSYY